MGHRYIKTSGIIPNYEKNFDLDCKLKVVFTHSRKRHTESVRNPSVFNMGIDLSAEKRV